MFPPSSTSPIRYLAVWCSLVFLLGLCTGCGTTKSQMATEQLLTSNAIDRSVAQLDFTVLQGEKVFLDTQYIPRNVKGQGFVSTEYIISSLRQQMFATGCHLVDDKKDAKYIVEARVGALGSDDHDVTYGLPANNLLTAASSIVPNSPPLPTIPEISVARRQFQNGAAKLAVFAYEQETLEPVWQSGLATATSSAKSMWLLGAGPFQRGTIYDGTQFAGQRIRNPLSAKAGDRHVEDFDREIQFVKDSEEASEGEGEDPAGADGGARVAGFEQPVEEGQQSEDQPQKQ